MYALKKYSLLSLFLLIGCQNEKEAQMPPETDSNRVRKEIEARGAEFIRHYEAKAVDEVAEIFAEDAHLMPPGMPAVVGRDAIREHIEQGMKLGTWHQRISTDLVVARDSLAVERGSFTISFSPDSSSPSIMTPFKQSGKYLIHWRLEGGVWRIANYIGNNDGSPVQQ